MRGRSFLMGLGLGLVLAGLASGLLFGGRWGGRGPAYYPPPEVAPQGEVAAPSGWRADGRFDGYYGYGWHRPHWGFPFFGMLMCLFPLLLFFVIPAFFFRRRHWHWRHDHNAPPPTMV